MSEPVRYGANPRIGGIAAPRRGRRVGGAARAAVAAALALALPWTAACGDSEGAEEREEFETGALADAQERPETEALAPADALENDRVRILVGGIPVRVEIADDPETRERGLMFRESLADDEGMLFVYPSERILSFWMRDTPIALDIAFLDRTGRIVDIQQLEPFDEETTSSRQPAMYALEVRQGWFEDHSVGIGDHVEF